MPNYGPDSLTAPRPVYWSVGLSELLATPPSNAINLHAVSDQEQYRYVESRLVELYRLYESRGEDSDGLRDEKSIQWPIPKNRTVSIPPKPRPTRRRSGRPLPEPKPQPSPQKIFLACKCKVRVEWPDDVEEMMRCYDPGCSVIGGRYHKECLGDGEMWKEGQYGKLPAQILNPLLTTSLRSFYLSSMYSPPTVRRLRRVQPRQPEFGSH